MALSFPLITLEEHFASPASVNVPQVEIWGPVIGGKLTSLSDSRIKDMDAGGVTRQVISHTPIKDAPSLATCQKINDHLHSAVRNNPDRLSGFAVLPMMQPADAATELRRAVQELGFVGALIDNHTEGIFYDADKYHVFWEEAEKLDVPIYLHPSFASDHMLEVNYRGNYPEEVAQALSMFVYGWHTETGLHFLRLFASGVFDRFPKLKLVLGHMGETIPYMLSRQLRSTGRWTHLRRGLKDVWDTNVWVTTSGMFDTVPLECLIKKTPLEHVLFSVDYPFSSNEMGAEFIKEIERQGILKGDDLKAFAYGNAEKLMKIKA